MKRCPRGALDAGGCALARIVAAGDAVASRASVSVEPDGAQNGVERSPNVATALPVVLEVLTLLALREGVESNILFFL